MSKSSIFLNIYKYLFNNFYKINLIYLKSGIEANITNIMNSVFNIIGSQNNNIKNSA